MQIVSCVLAEGKKTHLRDLYFVLSSFACLHLLESAILEEKNLQKWNILQIRLVTVYSGGLMGHIKHPNFVEKSK